VDLLHKKLYGTTDEGSSFDESFVPFSPDRLFFHPTQQDYILAYTYNDRTVSTSTCFIYVNTLCVPAMYTFGVAEFSISCLLNASLAAKFSISCLLNASLAAKFSIIWPNKVVGLERRTRQERRGLVVELGVM